MRYQATFMCLKRGHFFYPTLPHQQGPNFSFGARGSRTSKQQGYRWCLRLPHIRATKVPMLLEAPAQTGTKVPMVLEALAHPSTKVAVGGRGSRTSEHQGADGARGSRTSEPPRFRGCSRLPHIRAAKVLEALAAKGEGLGGFIHCWLSEFYPWIGEGPGGFIHCWVPNM